jgi:hypothetical protein
LPVSGRRTKDRSQGSSINVQPQGAEENYTTIFNHPRDSKSAFSPLVVTIWRSTEVLHGRQNIISNPEVLGTLLLKKRFGPSSDPNLGQKNFGFGSVPTSIKKNFDPDPVLAPVKKNFGRDPETNIFLPGPEPRSVLLISI